MKRNVIFILSQIYYINQILLASSKVWLQYFALRKLSSKTSMGENKTTSNKIVNENYRIFMNPYDS